MKLRAAAGGTNVILQNQWLKLEDQMSSTIAADIEIRSPRADETAAIAEHNVLMARETENKELDLLVVQKGVAAVINDPTKGFFIVAVASDGHILGNVMVTSEWVFRFRYHLTVCLYPC